MTSHAVLAWTWVAPRSDGPASWAALQTPLADWRGLPGRRQLKVVTRLVWWWRTLSWFDVRRAHLWQGVIGVGVVAGVILGLLMWSL